MSFSAPDPVASGHVYRIVSVNGSVPVTLEQFIGAASFAVLNYGAGSSRIRGQGSAHGEACGFRRRMSTMRARTCVSGRSLSRRRFHRDRDRDRGVLMSIVVTHEQPNPR